ncbi:hypothetical protein AAG570_008510 [Ranatra chinensis]|uniref:Uncharacterized protein n=1 Tax=Ranatra chinensis TaxID=642074 RepID=A0ABD0YR82_9HEMI
MSSRPRRGRSDKRTVFQNVLHPSRSAESTCRDPKNAELLPPFALPKHLPDSEVLVMELPLKKDVPRRRDCKVTIVKNKSAVTAKDIRNKSAVTVKDVRNKSLVTTKDVRNEKVTGALRPEMMSGENRKLTDELSTGEMDYISEKSKKLGNCLASLESKFSKLQHVPVRKAHIQGSPNTAGFGRSKPINRDELSRMSPSGRLYNVTDYTPVMGCTSEAYFYDLTYKLADNYDNAVTQFIKKTSDRQCSVEKIRSELKQWRSREHRRVGEDQAPTAVDVGFSIRHCVVEVRASALQDLIGMGINVPVSGVEWLYANISNLMLVSSSNLF